MGESTGPYWSTRKIMSLDPNTTKDDTMLSVCSLALRPSNGGHVSSPPSSPSPFFFVGSLVLGPPGSESRTTLNDLARNCKNKKGYGIIDGSRLGPRDNWHRLGLRKSYYLRRPEQKLLTHKILWENWLGPPWSTGELMGPSWSTQKYILNVCGSQQKYNNWSVMLLWLLCFIWVGTKTFKWWICVLPLPVRHPPVFCFEPLFLDPPGLESHTT